MHWRHYQRWWCRSWGLTGLVAEGEGAERKWSLEDKCTKVDKMDMGQKREPGDRSISGCW